KVPPEGSGAPGKPADQAEGGPSKPAAPMPTEPAATETPAKPGAPGQGAEGPGKPAPVAPPAAVAAGPPKAAAPPSKPAAPAKPAPPAPKPVVKPEPWSSPLVDELRKRFPGAVGDALMFRSQPSIVVAKEALIAIGEFLKSEAGGAYTFLTDETAVDYPKRAQRFEVIYQLYSFKLNHRLRLKVLLGEGESVPSVAGVWPTANWLEREVFDMFGVQYEGHPDLRRILLPEEWVGHPLRKDYDILKQDDAWVEANLHIKSGQ